MDPQSRAANKNTSHGNEALLQGNTHLIQRPCYQQNIQCQDPAGNWTTCGSPDHCKEMQTEVEWTCLLFIGSGQNHLARHSEREKKTRQTEEKPRRQHQGDRPRFRQVPEGGGGLRKVEQTSYEVICSAHTTPAVKGYMKMVKVKCFTISPCIQFDLEKIKDLKIAMCSRLR